MRPGKVGDSAWFAPGVRVIGRTVVVSHDFREA
jgi:hypothetical protein